jgi:N12 class adenine-specific DNA methylase
MCNLFQEFVRSQGYLNTVVGRGVDKNVSATMSPQKELMKRYSVEQEVESYASWRMELDDDIQTGNDAHLPEGVLIYDLFTRSTLYSIAKP